jgi:chromosome segregation ATPase
MTDEEKAYESLERIGQHMATWKDRAEKAEARIKELQEALRVQFEKTSEAEARVKSLEAEADSCTIFVGKMEAERDDIKSRLDLDRPKPKKAGR